MPVGKIVTLKSRPCPGCQRIIEIKVRESDLTTWKNGALIQHAFPYLSAEQRESLISGYCDPCWDSLCKAGEDLEAKIAAQRVK